MASKSAIRCLKKKRTVNRVWDRELGDYVYEGLERIPSGPHAPGGKEAKLVRRLMSETGLTEEQLREHKKYRVMLAEAHKSESKSSGFYSARKRRREARIVKNICRNHPGKPKEHPEMQALIKVALEESRHRFW
jgi:hypothetical protein